MISKKSREISISFKNDKNATKFEVVLRSSNLIYYQAVEYNAFHFLNADLVNTLFCVSDYFS